jgi:hypothetical protein
MPSTQIKIGIIFLEKQRTHLKNGSSPRKQTLQNLHYGFYIARLVYVDV